MRHAMRLVLCLTVCLALCRLASAKYTPTKHRPLKPGEIAVDKPGSYDADGATYVLTKDVSSPRSAIFLGGNVTLDLNGYTITYADGGYRHVPNYDFSEGLKGWDVSKAPGAKVRQVVCPLVGRNSLVLPAGQEIASPYIALPVADRAYYGLAAMAHHQMHVGIYLEDEQGKPVECAFRFGNRVRPCCPEPDRCSKLGGGTVFALMFGRPAGKYRIRVKAVGTDCEIGAIDIRPALDVGVGIVAKTYPWAYYRCILDGDKCAFFDYTKPGTAGAVAEGVPVAKGRGRVTVRNGVIRSGFRGIRSWGLQSTASDVELVVENVAFQAGGINTNAIDAPAGVVKDCRVELDTPWIIDRHRIFACGVAFYGGRGPCRVSGSDFLGGQGQLKVSGDGSDVHDNLFVNKQTVVNHYSVAPGGRGTKIYRNRFLPEQGSGILIFRQRDVEVFDNEFRITASPPVNEYQHSDYSVSAVRVTDYNSAAGDPKGTCAGNRIYRNRIHLTGRAYSHADAKYMPMAYGVFMSTGGGRNYVHDNEITIRQENGDNGKFGAFAFYVGGSNQGGEYYGNTITTNVTPVWISNRYGVGRSAVFHDNRFVKSEGAGEFPWFLLGWYKFPTENVGLFSNTFVGAPVSVRINDYTTRYVSQYAFGWTLTVKAAAGTEVTVLDASGAAAFSGKTDAKGILRARLPEYKATGKTKTDTSQYTVKATGRQKQVTLTKDTTVTFRIGVSP